MAALIRFVLSNFSLSFLIVGLIASGIALLRAPTPLAAVGAAAPTPTRRAPAT